MANNFSRKNFVDLIIVGMHYCAFFTVVTLLLVVSLSSSASEDTPDSPRNATKVGDNFYYVMIEYLEKRAPMTPDIETVLVHLDYPGQVRLRYYRSLRNEVLVRARLFSRETISAAESKSAFVPAAAYSRLRDRLDGVLHMASGFTEYQVLQGETKYFWARFLDLPQNVTVRGRGVGWRSARFGAVKSAAASQRCEIAEMDVLASSRDFGSVRQFTETVEALKDVCSAGATESAKGSKVWVDVEIAVPVMSRLWKVSDGYGGATGEARPRKPQFRVIQVVENATKVMAADKEFLKVPEMAFCCRTFRTACLRREIFYAWANRCPLNGPSDLMEVSCLESCINKAI